MARSVVDKNEKDIRALIGQVTGFEEYEENFSICLQFVVSNLKFHRYLSVDSHKVTRTLEGICEKFKIHSEAQKYKALKDLSDKFLQSAVFEHKDVGKTDTHYSILSFLLLVANNPISSEYVDTRTVAAPEIRDEFDWGAYLLEGVERYEPEDDELSDWTDEEDTLEDIPGVPSLGQRQESARVTQSENQQIAPYTVTDGSADQWEEPIILEGADWLTRNLVAQYWRGEKMVIETGKYRACHLNNDWEAYKQKMDPLSGNKNRVVVTEIVLLREVIWLMMGVSNLYLLQFNGHYYTPHPGLCVPHLTEMLMGVSNLYLLQFNGRYFTPRPGLCVPHLTEEVLQEFLADFTRFGSYLQILHNFVEECYHSNSTSRTMCQTLQSFSTTVADFLQGLRTELAALEQKLIKQEEVVTLLTFARQAKPLLRQVGIVFVVYVRGVHEGRGLEMHSQRATLLLTTLYNTMIGGDTLFEVSPAELGVEGPPREEFDNSEMLRVLLPMWIQTVQPYINIIDTWISHGNMTDPCAEFIIHRNEDISTLDETYWEKSFAFHTMSKDNNRDKPSQCGGKREVRPAEYSAWDWAPAFLQPVLQQIVLTGKSMEMLEGLGKLASEHDGKAAIDVAASRCKSMEGLAKLSSGHVGKAAIDVAEFKEGHLYDKFLSSLQSLMGTKSPHVTMDTGAPPGDQAHQMFASDIELQMKEKGTHDNFLKLHFERLLKRNDTQHSILEQSFTDAMESLDLDSLQPVGLILQECFYPHIQLQYTRVCLKLVQVLKTDYRLLGYLASMRKFFLMEAGDTMFKFYTELFDKIRLHEHWKDTTSVTWALHEALDKHFPDELSRLAVIVETAEGQREIEPIAITNCLKLHYEIPSPVDVVINERCQQIYNQIFSFLLQIKRAKYSLDELRFCDLCKESLLDPTDTERFLSSRNTDNVPRAAKIHSMHLLRMVLINFVNSLHNYIMTRILHSTGLEFARDLETAVDLDQIIEIHAGYVRKIHERCLLHHRNKFLKEAVLKMLNLVLRFQQEWDQGIDQISSKQIEDMQTEFSRSIQFLSSFLRRTIQRGSFPHLEALALGLQSLVPS